MNSQIHKLILSVLDSHKFTKILAYLASEKIRNPHRQIDGGDKLININFWSEVTYENDLCVLSLIAGNIIVFISKDILFLLEYY